MLNGDADKYCQLAGKQWYEFAAAWNILIQIH